MKNFFRANIFFLILVGVTFTPFTAQLIIHEQRHAEIYRSYNCSDVEIHIPEVSWENNDLLLARTTATCPGILEKPEVSRLMEVEHRGVHTVSRLTQPFVLLLGFLLSLKTGEIIQERGYL